MFLPTDFTDYTNYLNKKSVKFVKSVGYIKKKYYLCTRKLSKTAPVAELVDALDLGSSVYDVQVRVLSGAQYYLNF